MATGSIAQLFHLARWFVTARLLGRHRPLQSVVFVTGGCDSSCRHCTKCNAAPDHFKKYQDIESDLRDSYASGARILDIEGPNLCSWTDAGRTPGDIFDLARKIGFYNISTMVPARGHATWKQLGASADILWVSIAGADDLDYLTSAAGSIHASKPASVDASHGENYSLYMVINSRNFTQIPTILDFMQSHPEIVQIAFNLHTPFPGTEHLALSQAQRDEVINQLISFKKQGRRIFGSGPDYRIMNSVSGLRNMQHLDFKRFCWICNFYYCDGRRSPVCIDDQASGLCDRCGFCMSGEMNAVFRFRPDTIIAGLKGRL